MNKPITTPEEVRRDDQGYPLCEHDVPATLPADQDHLFQYGLNPDCFGCDKDQPGTCILTPENIRTEDDCTTHDHTVGIPNTVKTVLVVGRIQSGVLIEQVKHNPFGGIHHSILVSEESSFKNPVLLALREYMDTDSGQEFGLTGPQGWAENFLANLDLFESGQNLLWHGVPTIQLRLARKVLTRLVGAQ